MYKAYKKKDLISYTIGLYPTLELINNKPDLIERVLINQNIKNLKQDKKIQELISLCNNKKINLEPASKKIEMISSKQNIPIMGVFKKYGIRQIKETHKYINKISPDKTHIILVNPTDTGNLGTIIKTVAQLGFVDIAIIKPSADIFAPKTIRASMGKIFSTNIEHFDDFTQYKSQFPNRILYTVAQTDRDSKELQEDTIQHIQTNQEKVSLIFGSEDHGISGKYKNQTQKIKIPNISSAERLNLGIEVGLTLYLLR